jgi:hypothetical protein
MMHVLNDPNTPPRERTEVAKAAAPYVHAKLNSVEQVVTTKTHEERLRELWALMGEEELR